MLGRSDSSNPFTDVDNKFLKGAIALLVLYLFLLLRHDDKKALQTYEAAGIPVGGQETLPTIHVQSERVHESVQHLHAENVAFLFLESQRSADLENIRYHEYLKHATLQNTDILDAESFAYVLYRFRQGQHADRKLVNLKQQLLDDALHDSVHKQLTDDIYKLNQKMQLAVMKMDLDALDDVITEAKEKEVPAEVTPLLPVARYILSKLTTDADTRMDQMKQQISLPQALPTKHMSATKVPVSEDSQMGSSHADQLYIGKHEGPYFPTDRFPIAVVAYNRPEALKSCLQSLLALDGLRKDAAQVTVYQDGNHAGVANVARSFGSQVNLVQRPTTPTDQTKVGAMRIADHYKFLLSHVFDTNPSTPHAIIVEDDMIFAPDFLHYFSQLAHLYDDDPSIYCITSWNDNGRKGLANDRRALYRTEFFVGLGWLISRRIYKNELERSWPSQHWDHWLRHPNQRKGRECIYPEVSRNYNIGVHGTHSDQAMYDRYFRDIVLNRTPRVDLGDTSRLTESKYQNTLVELFKSATHLSSISHIKERNVTNAVVALYYQATGPEDTIWEKDIAPYFGLWHSIPHIRGMHRGVNMFRWKQGNLIMLVASYSPFVRYKPQHVNFLTRSDFGKSFSEIDPAVRVVVAQQNQDCDTACGRSGGKCDLNAFEYLNNCEAMNANFKCKGCRFNIGTDQPAFVSDAQDGNYEACLLNGGPFSCQGKHPVTQRLCPCRS